MDTFVVVWGGVVGWGLVLTALLVSAVCVGLLVLAPHTRFGRAIRSIARARPLARASLGDRVLVFGRVEVDGPAARRFDDLAPCALASLETPAGTSLSRGAALFLRTGKARIRLTGAVSIEATSDAHAASGQARVASLAIGEHALVVGRFEREAEGAASGYRAPVFAVAIGASNEPIDVIGTRRVMRLLSRLVSVATAPALAIGTLGVALAAATLNVPRVAYVVDELGSGERRVPLHLALPLLSPVHRDDALREIDSWLTWELGGNEFPDAHVVDLAVAMRPLVPSCEREARLALAAPGGRSAAHDGCDETVGAWLIRTSGERDPDPARRRGYWDDLVTSVARAPELGPSFACGASLCTTARDEWERLEAILRRRDHAAALDGVAAMHLRRLAVLEAVYADHHTAMRLARAARRLAENTALDDSVDEALRGLDYRGAVPGANDRGGPTLASRLRTSFYSPHSTVDADLDQTTMALALEPGRRHDLLSGVVGRRRRDADEARAVVLQLLPDRDLPERTEPCALLVDD